MLLFDPQSVCNTICNFGEINDDFVFQNSHKLVFVPNQNQPLLWDLNIVDNSYTLAAGRTIGNIATKYFNIKNIVQQSVDILIKNLGCFHLAIETALCSSEKESIKLRENTEHFIAGLHNIKKIYPDKLTLTKYIDKQIIPLVKKYSQLVAK